MPLRQAIRPLTATTPCFHSTNPYALHSPLHPSPSIPSAHQLLHTSRILSQTHYDTLNVPPTASAGDIKKSFYSLSKTHHPDRNPTNQEEASKNFVAINDAYAVLSHPDSRAKYDREVMPAQQPRSRGGGFQAGGTYSSAGAGGRTASGLSRRRSAFRGPPPSFYRSGGWGEQKSKRESAAGADGRAEWERMRAEQQQQQQQQQQGTAGAQAEGSGDGSWPFSRDPNDVPHFDRAGHYRTQSTVEEQLRQGRRKRRVLWDEVSEQGFASEFRAFVAVGAVVLIGVGGPIFFMKSGMGGQGKAKKERGGEGS